jgi:hypothetical protein
MKMLPFAMTIALALAAIGGCHDRGAANREAARAALDLFKQADQFELLSLNPVFDPKHPETPAPKFHGWDVIGKTTITNSEVRTKLIAALRNAVADPPPGKVGCFNPRHGIHAIHQGDAIDLVICFECEIALVYTNDEETSGFHITSPPRVTFNKTLLEAGISLAPGSQ